MGITIEHKLNSNLAHKPQRVESEGIHKFQNLNLKEEVFPGTAIVGLNRNLMNSDKNSTPS
jgi:hypothetical protein